MDDNNIEMTGEAHFYMSMRVAGKGLTVVFCMLTTSRIAFPSS